MSRTETVVTIMGLAILSTAIGVNLAAPRMAHGDYTIPSLLFPFALLSEYIVAISSMPSGNASFCLIVFGLAQFPLYGVLLAEAYISDRFKSVAWRLVALHMILGIGCALIYAAE